MVHRRCTAARDSVTVNMTGAIPQFDDNPSLELTIILPCLDEAETLAICIKKADAALRDNSIFGEVIVADNGSTDGSPQNALAHGAPVVPVRTRGYGAALKAGIQAARGRYVLIADADDS
jgi:glycosyltransferase involved in cell wall biosynthesis